MCLAPKGGAEIFFVDSGRPGRSQALQQKLKQGTRGNGWREGCNTKSDGMGSGCNQKLKHYTKIAHAEATDWMTRRLVRGGQNIPWKDVEGLAKTWAEGASLSDIDPKIMEIEAMNMTKQWA